MDNSNLAAEWQLLQNQFDSYEKYSLVNKLLAFILCFTALTLSNYPGFLVIILMAALWLQDGIWKTFQSRIEARILNIEQALSQSHTDSTALMPFQFNSEFLKSRPSGLGLLLEYGLQSLRPTVAFPHFLLITLVAINLLFSAAL